MEIEIYVLEHPIMITEENFRMHWKKDEYLLGATAPFRNAIPEHYIRMYNFSQYESLKYENLTVFGWFKKPKMEYFELW